MLQGGFNPSSLHSGVLLFELVLSFCPTVTFSPYHQTETQTLAVLGSSEAVTSDNTYILRLVGRIGVMPLNGWRRGEGMSSEGSWLKGSDCLVFKGSKSQATERRPTVGLSAVADQSPAGSLAVAGPGWGCSEALGPLGVSRAFPKPTRLLESPAGIPRTDRLVDPGGWGESERNLGDPSL